MSDATTRIALVTEVFFGEGAEDRLRQRLRDARDAGAALAVLPELPLNRWCLAAAVADDADAEPPDGPRARAQSAAARDAGIGLIGGAIIVGPDGSRRNTALVFDTVGRLCASYEKMHLPAEPGYRETDHYDPGETPAGVVEGLGPPLAVQICSDINRPQAALAACAAGAELIVVPRATEAATFDRWRPVLRAVALTGCTWVVSVNRPGPEADVLIGGPSVAVDPDGRVVLETEEPLGIVEIPAEAVATARTRYPGYLAVRSREYARSWREVEASP